jgi:transcriptional regulator with XRE-family HTH domain
MWKRYQKRLYPVVRDLHMVRVSRRIKREVIAERLGYHKMTVGRWERGENQPSLQALHDWAEVLGVEIAINDCLRESHRDAPKPQSAARGGLATDRVAGRRASNGRFSLRLGERGLECVPEGNRL